MAGAKMDKNYRGLDSQAVPTLRVQASWLLDPVVKPMVVVVVSFHLDSARLLVGDFLFAATLSMLASSIAQLI